MTPLRYSNRYGFPCIENVSTNLTTSELTYTFNRQPQVNNYFYGGLFIKLNNTPEAPSAAVPVQFTTQNGPTISVLNKEGNAVTTATITDGIYIAFYDRDTNKLQLLNI